MDFLYMLNRKLDFVQFFHSTAARSFLAEMEKIEKHEPPYDQFDPEDGDPPFVDEWIEFSDGLRLLGYQTLSTVSVVLQEYLAAATHQLGLGDPPKRLGRAVFERFRDLTFEKTGLDIGSLGADMSLIEEMFLARNRIQHIGDIGTNWVYQDEEYARKFPKAEFAERSWIEDQVVVEGPPLTAPLQVTHEKIERAITEVRKLCEAIEREFLKNPAYG